MENQLRDPLVCGTLAGYPYQSQKCHLRLVEELSPFTWLFHVGDSDPQIAHLLRVWRRPGVEYLRFFLSASMQLPSRRRTRLASRDTDIPASVHESSLAKRSSSSHLGSCTVRRPGGEPSAVLLLLLLLTRGATQSSHSPLLLPPHSLSLACCPRTGLLHPTAPSHLLTSHRRCSSCPPQGGGFHQCHFF